jgi:lipopolysaccharide export system protein LptA
MNRLKNNLSPQRWLALLLPLLLCCPPAAFAERADRGKPMHLEANTVSVDDVNQISTFEGNVELLQGTLSIQADKIVVTQDKEGYQHCTASGRLAHFRQKRDGADEYVEGYGERIEYDTRNEVAEFFGQARIKREGDDVRGEHITYSTRTEVFKVSGEQPQGTDKPGSGRVTLIIQPQNRATDSAASAVAPASAPLPGKPAPTINQPRH